MSGFWLMAVENPGPCSLMLASPFIGLAAGLLRHRYLIRESSFKTPHQ